MSSSHTEAKLGNGRVLDQVRDWDGLARAAAYRPSQLAALCQVSLRTLQRHFKKHYALQVRSWLKDARMNSAYAHIQSGSSVKEAAFDLGYTQLSHFSRDFKKHFGIAPSFLLSHLQSKNAPRQEGPGSPQMVFTF